MILRALLLFSLLVLSACALPRPSPRGDIGPVAEPLDPSIKPLVQEQEEQAE